MSLTEDSFICSQVTWKGFRGGGRLATFADLSFSACRAFFRALMGLQMSKKEVLLSQTFFKTYFSLIFVSYWFCLSWSLIFCVLSSFRASRKRSSALAWFSSSLWAMATRSGSYKKIWVTQTFSSQHLCFKWSVITVQLFVTFSPSCTKTP